MTTHSAVAKKVREDKERHPERFCSDPRCLWRTSVKPCPKHAAFVVPCKRCNGTNFLRKNGVNFYGEDPTKQEKCQACGLER